MTLKELHEITGALLAAGNSPDAVVLTRVHEGQDAGRYGVDGCEWGYYRNDGRSGWYGPVEKPGEGEGWTRGIVLT